MNITIKDLLDAGVHFGHQVRRFNPKSKKFVFDNRNGISVIDLEKTYAQLETAAAAIEEVVASGKDVLFVGTKKQAREIVREAATSSGMPFCAERWLGGTLTNWTTIKRSIDKYRKYMKMENEGEFDKMHNKEVAAIRREMLRMRRNFEGIVDLKGMPGAIFIVDTKHEEIAVAEARRLKVPVFALVDTNSDPSLLDYPIPGNDDSMKSIRIIVETILDAVQAGLARRSVKETVPTRTITPTVSVPSTEEQVPVTFPARRGGGEDVVPESYSSDSDDNK
ncbi:MAG: 30S ribosomal protein S2 [Opitutales bacterium]|nr:30S ribosomal protein S2 [Opitutales bacterium]